MEERTFKSYFIDYLDTRDYLEEAKDNLSKATKPIEKKELAKRVEQLNRKMEYLQKKMEHFGEGSVIEISGRIRTPTRRSRETLVTTAFNLLLVNITEADAREYFEKIVKLKYKNILIETIQIKQLPVGVLKIIT